jgi:hypothetical protein
MASHSSAFCFVAENLTQNIRKKNAATVVGSSADNNSHNGLTA